MIPPPASPYTLALYERDCQTFRARLPQLKRKRAAIDAKIAKYEQFLRQVPSYVIDAPLALDIGDKVQWGKRGRALTVQGVGKSIKVVYPSGSVQYFRAERLSHCQSRAQAQARSLLR